VPAVSGRRWAVVGVGLAFGAIALALLVTSALDDGGDDASTPVSSLRVESIGDAAAPFSGLTVTQLSVGGDCKRLVVADDEPERVAGLRGRETAEPYDGMVFVFDSPTTTAFTMSGVVDPIQIAFYDGDGRPVSRSRMAPCPKADASCPVYEAGGKFVYAVETRPGALPTGALSSCA